MTFFELREAALSEAALSEAALREAASSVAALSVAPLRGAAAVVTEAEERQGEEEEDERFAYRLCHLTDTRTCRFAVVPYRPHHSTFGHQNTCTSDIRCAEVWRGR